MEHKHKKPTPESLATNHAAHGAADGVGLVLAGHHTVLVELGHVELDRGVVAGANQAVGRGAVRVERSVARTRRGAAAAACRGQHGQTDHLRGMYRSTTSPASFCMAVRSREGGREGEERRWG